MHALHGGRSLHLEGLEAVEALQLVVGQNERTDGSVRTDVSTLVTLDTVVLVPSGNEGLNTALLVSGSTHLPRTVDSAVLDKCTDRQQVAGLSVDRTNELLNEYGSVILLLGIVREVSPFGLHDKHFGKR